jgi:hypothetical protein
MAWFWSYGRDVDAAVDAPSDEALPERSEDFPAQADAETWLGQEFGALLESGIENVTLFENDREVYGPMSLRPE